jgi:hypothetical protein
MRKVAVAALLATVTTVAFAAPALPAQKPSVAPISDEERAYCARELSVVEQRRRIFEAQGLAPAEIARKNESDEQAVTECRRRYKREQRRVVEELAEQDEIARRAGPNPTEIELDRVTREVRRERLAAKSPADLTPGEKAELAAGMQEEMAATHAMMDTVHARDPVFMRQVHSALACYHGDRAEILSASVQEEQTHLKLGSGDRQKLYALQSELRQSREVLSRSREAARQWSGGLLRCSDPQTAILAHCLAIRFEGRKSEPACDSEEIQQFIRFVK